MTDVTVHLANGETVTVHSEDVGASVTDHGTLQVIDADNMLVLTFAHGAWTWIEVQN